MKEHQEAGKIPPLFVSQDGLGGDWILTQCISGLEELEQGADSKNQVNWLLNKIEQGMKDMVAAARERGITSLAVVPFGANLAVSPGQSLDAILAGLLAAKNEDTTGNNTLDSVAICEIDPDRYQEIKNLVFERPGVEKDFLIKELEGDPPLRIRKAPLSLNIRQEEDGKTLNIIIAGEERAAAEENSHPVDWEQVDEAYFGKPSPPSFAKHRHLGRQLSEIVFSTA